MNKFELGQIVRTTSINNLVAEDNQFAADVSNALARYTQADFSDMEYQDDVESNNRAIETGEERIFAAYNTCKGKIWIITEWDRSITTVLFPDEY